MNSTFACDQGPMKAKNLVVWTCSRPCSGKKWYGNTEISKWRCLKLTTQGKC